MNRFFLVVASVVAFSVTACAQMPAIGGNGGGGGGGTGCNPTGPANHIVVTDGANACDPSAMTISGSTATGSLTGAASLNLLKSSNLSDLASAATARTNLGLTALATTTPGTGVATALAIAADATGGFCVVGGSGCPGGGSGTVTVVSSGSLTSTALVTGGGTTTIQTPSATATLDSSGNFSTPGSLTTGAGGSVGGYTAFGQGTATTAPTSSVGFMAPTSVTTKFMMTLPAAPVTGFLYNTGTSDPSTISLITAIPSATTATTQSQNDNSTKIATTAYVDRPVLLPAAGTSVSLAAPREYYVCSSTCTVTPPVPAAGLEFCVRNGNNVSTVITLAAIGSSARYENTANTAYGTAGTGTFVSGGAVGDKVCIVGLDSTHYTTWSYAGTWTAN